MQILVISICLIMILFENTKIHFSSDSQNFVRWTCSRFMRLIGKGDCRSKWDKFLNENKSNFI